jgi:hypothetical protein
VPHLVSRAIAGAVAGASLLAACGGSGGGVAPPAGVATVAAPAASLPGSGTAALTGRIVDGDLAPPVGIAGALIRIGTTFASGTIGGPVASASSAADGSFALAVPLTASLPGLPSPLQPPAPYPQVPTPPPGTVATLFVQIDAPPYATLHRVLYLQPGAVAAGAFALTTPSADELDALVQLNADRARLGIGAGALPLALDGDLVATARFVAATMAADGFYAHLYPGTAEAVNVQYCAWPGFCGRYVTGPAENEDTGVANLVQAEAAYVAEGPGGGHYDALVDPRNRWVGFGEAFGGLCPDHVSRLCSYFAEEFALAPP